MGEEMEKKEELYNFYAMLDRMQYIQEYPSGEPERAQLRCGGHCPFAGTYS